MSRALGQLAGRPRATRVSGARARAPATTAGRGLLHAMGLSGCGRCGAGARTKKMRFDVPDRFFSMLCCEATGNYATSRVDGDDVSMALSDRAIDAAMWTQEESGIATVRLLRNAVTGCRLKLSAVPGTNAPRTAGEQGFLCTAEHDGLRVRVGGDQEIFRLLRGPCELPSESLAHLRQEGWVVLPQLLHPDTTAEIRQSFRSIMDEAFAGKDMRGQRISLPDTVNASPNVVKSAVHPLALYLLEEYIKSPIHLGHPPATAIVAPQDETYEHFGRNTQFQSTADRGGWCG